MMLWIAWLQVLVGDFDSDGLMFMMLSCIARYHTSVGALVGYGYLHVIWRC